MHDGSALSRFLYLPKTNTADDDSLSFCRFKTFTPCKYFLFCCLKVLAPQPQISELLIVLVLGGLLTVVEFVKGSFCRLNLKFLVICRIGGVRG